MSELEDILEHVTPEDILLREGCDYKMAFGASGEQLHVKECPSCGNNKWKVYMNAETGRGNCFRCDWTFNAFTFAKKLNGDRSNAVVFDYLKGIAREIGWRPKKKKRQKKAVDEAHVALPASFALPTEDGQNVQYLEDRGFDGECAAYFNWRYCHRGSFGYMRDSQMRFQDFGNRVIIPVYDLDGKLVTFQGRDITGTAERKYLFPIGLPSTGKYLYNGHNAVGAAHIVMGEGALDVAAIKVALEGDGNMHHIEAVGSFGKNLSFATGDDQKAAILKLRASGLRQITIMWDGEKDALKSALEAGKKINALGIKARIALLPAGCDPNETTPEIVRQAIKDAVLWDKRVAMRMKINNPYK